ncbi:hypothetical protein [Paraburkholderia kirstenboschensis]|uniref:Uncharacterized protein n=1 Tax=Paraburkholderia kirstenboschensis TaxID=1245436 RepID=A0ABZ0E9G9_9BURK|nr:hypothetical protein [Paraburkholderia kirstenboschensis]WOD13888.1 hypothetical protein RW095_08160 [Paraburkholderia kirstenboschensis]
MLKAVPHGGFVRAEAYRHFRQRHIVHLYWQHREPPRVGQLAQQHARERAHFMLARCLFGLFVAAGQHIFELERVIRLPESKSLLIASSIWSGVGTSVAAPRDSGEIRLPTSRRPRTASSCGTDSTRRCSVPLQWICLDARERAEIGNAFGFFSGRPQGSGSISRSFTR